MNQDQIREQLGQLEWLLDGPFNETASSLMDALILAVEERQLLWGLAGCSGSTVGSFLAQFAHNYL